MTVEGPGSSGPALLEELEKLLSEPLSDACSREQALAGEVFAHPDMPVVLFGAGNLGRRTLALLRDHGRAVAAFIDNDSSLWGKLVADVPVLSPAEASASFADSGLALVTIWRAEGGHDFCVTRDTLRGLGWRRVESFIPLYWGLSAEALPYLTIDLPSRLLVAKQQVRSAAHLWADERSLCEFVGQVRWRLTADFRALSPAEPRQYFAEDVVDVGTDEVFVDCGAFTGDTLLDVANTVGAWSRYHAFEPDPATFAELRRTVASLPALLANRVELYRAAVADCRRIAWFSATGQASASLSASGECQVDCVTLDEVLRESRPSFIKMDVEGTESAALMGARELISRDRPLLAVSAYHRQADLWELPLLVRSLAKDDRLFLRPHAREGFDAVLYAVPPERRADR